MSRSYALDVEASASTRLVRFDAWPHVTQAPAVPLASSFQPCPTAPGCLPAVTRSCCVSTPQKALCPCCRLYPQLNANRS